MISFIRARSWDSMFLVYLCAVKLPKKRENIQPVNSSLYVVFGNLTDWFQQNSSLIVQFAQPEQEKYTTAL